MENVIKALQEIQAKAFKAKVGCTLIVEGGVRRIFFSLTKGEEKIYESFHQEDGEKEIEKKIAHINDFLNKGVFEYIWNIKVQMIYQESIRPAGGSESGVDDIDRPQIANITAQISGQTLESACAVFETYAEKELEVINAKYNYQVIQHVLKEEVVYVPKAEVQQFDYTLQYDYSGYNEDYDKDDDER